jgi:3-oxoacyl-[acyl-carrier-protein] synthase-3
VNQKLQFIEFDGVAIGREYLNQSRVIPLALKKAGLTLGDVKLFIFHQANIRLIRLLMKKLKLPMSKTYTNIDRYGNTADASSPMALCEAWEEGLIKRGDIVVVSGEAAGSVIGTTVLRWY